MKAVVLLSGGIDSTTTMAIAKAEGYDVYALTFDYGQRHRRELESARNIASVLGVKEHLIIKFDLRVIGGSALTSDIEVPKTTPLNPPLVRGTPPFTPPLVRGEIQGGIPVTYVPARNTIFLSFALAWAEVLGVEDIFIGANALDYSGYPDCRADYIESFERLANLATKSARDGKSCYRIRSPLINMTKAEIIRKGLELRVDYGLTWSCYDPRPKRVQSSEFRVKSKDKISKLQTPNSKLQTLYVPCGRCDSCLFREKGFQEAKINDPLLIKY
jgi:7-cyano-7-deazaguanine synthase